MAFYNLPASLTNLVQTGWLKRDFVAGLNAKLAYRMAAELEPFEGRVGVTTTLTKMGRKAVATTPLDGSTRVSNTNNGLTPSNAPDEQYTITINEYGDAIPLNMVDDEVVLKSQFLDNGRINGEQAAQTLDTLCLNALLNSYMGGDTRAINEVGPTTTRVYVDDVRGFETVFSNGSLQTVSPTYPLTVTESGTTAQSFTCTGVVRDVSNISTAAVANGWSGYLTISPAAGSTPTVGDRLQAADGSIIIRPNARSTTAGLLGSDLLKYQNILDAAKVMDKQNVPRFADGTFKCILDDDGCVQLQSDPRLQIAFQGRFDSKEMQAGFIGRLGGVSFFRTNLAPIQPNSGSGGNQTVHRAMLVGSGAVLEADFKGKEGYVKRAKEWSTSHVELVEKQYIMITRGPIDVLAENITQAWKSITGFACPSDTTVTTSVTPTASNARYKRAVIIEYVG